MSRVIILIYLLFTYNFFCTFVTYTDVIKEHSLSYSLYLNCLRASKIFLEILLLLKYYVFRDVTYFNFDFSWYTYIRRYGNVACKILWLTKSYTGKSVKSEAINRRKSKGLISFREDVDGRMFYYSKYVLFNVAKSG